MKKRMYRGMTLLLCLLMVFTLCFSSLAQSEGEDVYYFTILHTNDEHSSMIPHSSSSDHREGVENPSIGGYPRLATIVNEIRGQKQQVQEPVLLLNGGDFMGGTAFSWMIPQGYAPELLIKQMLGYDGVTIGNHEYDYGTDVLTDYFVAAGYPKAHDQTVVIAANTLVDASHPLVQQDLFRQYHIKELENGLVVGMFGLIGKDAIHVASDYDPFTFEDQVTAAKNTVAHLQSHHVDVIIALSHSGVDEDRELVKQVDGIDIMIGGHCHTELHQPVIENNTVIVQAGAYLEYVGVLELAYDKKAQTLKVMNQDQPFLIPLDSRVAEDATIRGIIDGWTHDLNQLIAHKTQGNFEDIHQVVAYSDFSLPYRPRMMETPFGNFITDAMRMVTSEVLGKKVDIAIQANGSIRGNLVPGSTDHSKGQITFYDLAQLISLGYGQDGYAGYPITSFYLTAEEIGRVLEVAALLPILEGDDYFLQFSGLRYTYNPKDAVLFTIPFLDLPLPSTRAVKDIYIYDGWDIQPDGLMAFHPLDTNREELYHVVADSYLLSFLPMAGEVLPALDIVPKDEQGNPVDIENFDRFVVYQENMELKVWQTVIQHAANQEHNENGLPQISSIYQTTSGRIVPVDTFPLVGWIIIGGVLIVSGLVVLIVLRKKRKKRGK